MIQINFIYKLLKVLRYETVTPYEEDFVKKYSPLLVIGDWLNCLISKGAFIVEQPIIEAFGAEAWMTDPEGNYLLVVVPNRQKGRFNIQ